MTDTLIFNASPTIFLAKARLFHVVQHMSARVMTTREVVTELSAKPQDADIASLLASTPWLEIISTNENAVSQTALAVWDLGSGETSVLASVISRPGAEAVLDDKAARRSAKALGIPCVGTLGILQRAKERALIPSFHDAVTRVIEAGLYLSPAILLKLRAEIQD